MVEIVVGRETPEVHGIFARLHGERLALAEFGGFFFVQNGSVAGENVDVAAVVKIVDSERTFAAGFDREIAAGDAEIIAVCRIHVEGSGALAEDQTGGAGAIVQRKVVKLENRVFIEKGHRAILKLHLGAAVIRGQHVALTDG